MKKPGGVVQEDAGGSPDVAEVDAELPCDRYSILTRLGHRGDIGHPHTGTGKNRLVLQCGQRRTNLLWPPALRSASSTCTSSRPSVNRGSQLRRSCTDASALLNESISFKQLMTHVEPDDTFVLQPSDHDSRCHTYPSSEIRDGDQGLQAV